MTSDNRIVYETTGRGALFKKNTAVEHRAPTAVLLFSNSCFRI